AALGAGAGQRLGGAGPAAEFAGAAGIGDQRQLLDQPGIAGLVDLDRDRAAVAVHAADRVVAVGARPAAPADGVDVVAGVVVAGLRVRAAEQEVLPGAAVRRRHTAGQRLRQRAERATDDP